jgi:hypothetical protein
MAMPAVVEIGLPRIKAHYEAAYQRFRNIPYHRHAHSVGLRTAITRKKQGERMRSGGRVAGTSVMSVHNIHHRSIAVTKLHASSPYLRHRRTIHSGPFNNRFSLSILGLHIYCLDLPPAPPTHARPCNLPSFVLPSTTPYLAFIFTLLTYTPQDGIKEEGSSQGTAAPSEICNPSLMRAGHYPGGQRGRQDQLDEPICTIFLAMSYIRWRWWLQDAYRGLHKCSRSTRSSAQATRRR